jgi:hypothetical protein
MITKSGVESLRSHLQKITVLSNYVQPFSNGCLKSPIAGVFYVRNLKAASSTYVHWLESLGWQPCDLGSCIDWEKDIVFGHILDPLKRYRKGLAMAFHYRADLKKLLSVLDWKNDNCWLDFIANLKYIDRHTLTLQLSLKDKAKQIYWIPIDIDIDHKSHTLEFLKLYNALPQENHESGKLLLDMENHNVSAAESIELYNALCQIPPSDLVQTYLDFDQRLYKTIIDYYLDPTNSV